jgi:hypothetical protein
MFSLCGLVGRGEWRLERGESNERRAELLSRGLTVDAAKRRLLRGGGGGLPIAKVLDLSARCR